MQPAPSVPVIMPLLPRDLPMRLVLKVPEPGRGEREVVYVLRYTRQGKLVLNKDEFALPGVDAR